MLSVASKSTIVAEPHREGIVMATMSSDALTKKIDHALRNGEPVGLSFGGDPLEKVSGTRLSSNASEDLDSKIAHTLLDRKSVRVSIGQESFEIVGSDSLAWGDNDGGWIYELKDSELLSAGEMEPGMTVNVLEKHASDEDLGIAEVDSTENLHGLVEVRLSFENGRRGTFRCHIPGQLWLEPETDSMLAPRGSRFGFKRCAAKIDRSLAGRRVEVFRASDTASMGCGIVGSMEFYGYSRIDFSVHFDDGTKRAFRCWQRSQICVECPPGMTPSTELPRCHFKVLT